MNYTNQLTKLKEVEVLKINNYTELMEKIYHILRTSISALNEVENKSVTISTIDVQQNLKTALYLLPFNEMYILDHLQEINNLKN